MQLEEAKQQFIQSWGALGSSWGISRTMSSIHALLITTRDPLSAEDIMAQLQISRGNANMNLRALIDWGLVQKQMLPGERKEYFTAGKDVWEIARQIANERRKRELEPAMKVVAALKDIDDDSEDGQHFKEVVGSFHDFTTKINSTVEKFVRSDKNWFYRSLMKLVQ